MTVKTIRDIAEDIKRAESILDVTDDEREGWLGLNETKLHILSLIQKHSDLLITLAGTESGYTAERIRGKIQILDDLMTELTQTEREDD